MSLSREHRQRHLHHADRALDDALPGRDDGAGLLPLQHRRGDLRRVGEVADAGLEHLDAGLGQPILDLALQVLGDRGGVAAQRGVLVVVRVVGIAGGEVAQRRLALDVDVVVVVVDLEERLGGVDDAPDDDRRRSRSGCLRGR